MKTLLLRTIITALLWGTLSTLHAQQHVVVIGKVQNIQEGTVFELEETTGTGSSKLHSKNTPIDNGKVINGRFVLDYNCMHPTSRHFALYSDSPGFTGRHVKLDFWANQGDTVYVEGNGKILGNWEVQTKAPEQIEWDLIRKSTARECEAYQQAWMDYEAYRQYRRDTEMSEAEWDRTKAILAQKDTLRTKNRLLWYKSQLKVMKELPVTDFWMDQLSTIIYFASNRRDMLEESIKELYLKHSDKIDRKPDGKAVREWVYPYPKAELGKPCVDSDLFDVNGKKHRLADFRGNLVKRLFEMEVPEIAAGDVTIKAIAREAGSRTKMAVHSNEIQIDPVGSCVGQRGSRVDRVVNELKGEKIDIIKWSEDPAEFIANALNPANVRAVYTEASGARSCIVVVPDNQQSLAIGKEGQNARLAARLTGYKIDIKPASQAEEE